MRGYARDISDEITGLVRRKYCLDYLRGLLRVAPTSTMPALGVILLDLDTSNRSTTRMVTAPATALSRPSAGF